MTDQRLSQSATRLHRAHRHPAFPLSSDQGRCDADGGTFELHHTERAFPEFGIEAGEPFRVCPVCADEREPLYE